jgi:hypothetical protein
MVVDLPGRVEGADAPGTEQLHFSRPKLLTDREVMELILFGTRGRVRAAMPLMTEEQKRSRQSQSGERYVPELATGHRSTDTTFALCAFCANLRQT